MTINEELRAELLRLKAEDGALWRELAEAGQLYGPHLPKDWYTPRMAPLHRGNTARLAEILAEHGWPGFALVGTDGTEAAWFIAQHAVVVLDFQREALAALTGAVARGEAPGLPDGAPKRWHDRRVRMGVGRAAGVGSTHVGDENGELVPYMTEDPENVEARRAAAGLPSLREKTEELKERVRVEGEVQRQAKTPGN
jgi:hypothetical protein